MGMDVTFQTIDYIGKCCLVHHLIQLAKYQFFINKHIFRHLKLEIVLAIPVLN